MSQLQIKNQDTKSFAIRNRAFSGFVISAVTIADTITAITTGTVIDPYKIRVSLRNNLTAREVFSESLAYMLRRTRKGDKDLYNMLHGTLAQRGYDISGDATKIISDWTLDFGDTYEGDYTLTVQTNDAMSTDFAASSHLEIVPDYSDDAMIYEAIYLDKSVDARVVDIELGNGIEEIQIVGVKTMNNMSIKDTKQIAINHSAGKQIFSQSLALCHSNSLHESGVESLGGDLTIHDGEVLSNCALHIEFEAALTEDKPVILYKKLIPNYNAEASQARANNKYERTWGLIDQGL